MKAAPCLYPLAIVVLFAQHAFAYHNDSQELGAEGSRLCSDPGVYTQTWTITPPYALDTGGNEVLLDFSALADLDASNEWINVTIGGTAFDEDLGGPPLGHLFASGGNTGCNFDAGGGTSGTAYYYMDADDWNALLASHGGEMEFFFSTPSTVQCLACTDGCKCGAAFEHPFSWVRVMVTYTEYECTPGASCNDGLYCTLDDECTDGVCVGGSIRQCPAAQVCDDLDDACRSDCNTDGLVDAYEFPDAVLSYDSDTDALPDSMSADPQWSKLFPANIDGVISNGVLLVTDDVSSNGPGSYSFYQIEDVFSSPSQSAVYEFRGRAISAARPDGIVTAWQAGVCDGSKVIELAITTTGVGFLFDADGFVPGCLADFDTTDGMHTYRVLKHGDSHAEVYADDQLLFSCAYDRLASAGAVNRAVLLASSSIGTSTFKIEYFRYSIGAVTLLDLDADSNGFLDECEASVDCNDNGVFDAMDIASGTSQDCNRNNEPDECDIAGGTSQDCNLNDVPDDCDVSDGYVGYDPSLGDLPNNAYPVWTHSGDISGVISNGLLYVDDSVISTKAHYNMPNALTSSAEDAIYEFRAQAIAATNFSPIKYAWQTGLEDGTKSIELAITTNQIGFLQNTNAFVPGCSATFVTNDGMHTYSVVKYGTDHVDVFADHDLLFSCPYDSLANVSSTYLALLLDTSSQGTGEFKIEYFRFAAGSLMLDEDDCNANGMLDECETSGGSTPDCNDNGMPDQCDLSAGTSLDCNANDVPDECDVAQGTSADCNTNGMLDICELADEVITYDAALGYLPTESDPAWTSGGTVPPTLVEDLLVVNDASTQALAFYYRPDVFADSSQSAVFETTGQAISATNSQGIDFAWQAGLDDGSKYIDLAITTTGVGILSTGSQYVPGCVAGFVTTDGLHTYKVLKYGTSHVDVFADGDLLFSCPYDDLAEAVPNRAVLLASSTPGRSSFKIASFHYAIGGLSLTGTDCNTNGVPDECDLMDFDTSGAVDLYDFAGFQICLGSTGGAYLESFDRAASCGVIDLNDYVVFAAQFAGPLPGGEMEMMMGGSGEAMSIAVDSSEAEAVPEEDPWTEEEASLTFEIRTLGGETGVTELAPNTTYEVHYQAGYGEINDYLLVAVAASTDQGLSGASAPSSGDWSPPVNFGFEDISADEDWAQDWDGEGNRITNLVYDYWLDTERSAGSEAHLCNITTGSAGVLKLELFMSWIDLEALEGVSMHASAEFVVAAPGGE